MKLVVLDQGGGTCVSHCPDFVYTIAGTIVCMCAFGM